MAINSLARSGLSRVSSPGNAVIDGTPTGTYTDSGINYAYFTYNSSSSITISRSGLATVLCVGGGGGGSLSGNVLSGGGAGGFREELVFLNAGSVTVTVGAGGAGAGSSGFVTSSNGNVSELVGYVKCGGGGLSQAYNTTLFSGAHVSPSIGGNGAAGAFTLHVNNNTAQTAGCGCGGSVFGGSTARDGRSSSITGSSITFGVGGNTSGSAGTANRGNGGDGGNNSGGSGIVIVRVRTN